MPWRRRRSRRPWRARRTRAVAFVLALLPSLAGAVTLETLIMPGPVVSDHADIEEQCEQCHIPFTKKEQKVRCVICHIDVAADLKRERGFHGRDPRAASLECKFCHSEHLGRDADIVGLDEGTFDHGMTDFHLEGAHSGVACEGCHAADHKHREAPGQCIGCHREDDDHRGELGEDCAACHSASAWKKADFDHSETEFPLLGKHGDVACAQCHANARYEGIATGCNACHALNDVHAGRFGDDCASCHRPQGWDDVSFDHGRETDFALAGRHREATCVSCHRGEPGADLESTCISCHEADDAHRGKNGTACDECHTPTGWKESRFDHERNTGFALEGEHRSLPCEACHRGALSDKLESTCVSCHRANDVHQGGLGKKCETCHSERQWGGVDFDHAEKANFPLKESHATLKCRQCHLPASKGEPPSPKCPSCHKHDDVHRGKLGERCSQCHNEKAWEHKVFFEHDLTRFPLIGIHVVTPCEECHASTAYVGTPVQCGECHADDDPHDGRLGGAACSECHNPNGWPLWIFDHDTRTDFVLDGAHEDLDCHACHTEQAATRGWVGRSCHACHGADDVHRGQFGRACERCHQTTSFQEVRGR